LNFCEAVKQKNILAKLAVLNKLSEATLPLMPNIYKNAIEISNIYSNKSNNGISFVDCYLSAFLKLHSKTLLLATINNKDFPQIIHDRLNVLTIDTKEEIINIGFYKFNEDSFNQHYSSIR